MDRFVSTLYYKYRTDYALIIQLKPEIIFDTQVHPEWPAWMQLTNEHVTKHVA